MQHKKKEKDENWAIWAASFSRHPRFASSYHVWKSFVGERRQKRIFLAEIFFSPVLTPFYQKKWRKEKLIVESYYAFSFKIFPLRCLMEGKFICTRLLREPLFVVNSGGLWRWRRLIVHSAQAGVLAARDSQPPPSPVYQFLLCFRIEVLSLRQEKRAPRSKVSRVGLVGEVRKLYK